MRLASYFINLLSASVCVRPSGDVIENVDLTFSPAIPERLCSFSTGFGVLCKCNKALSYACIPGAGMSIIWVSTRQVICQINSEPRILSVKSILS